MLHFYEKPYGPNTHSGLQMLGYHNKNRTLKEYEERMARRFDSAHRKGRPHFYKKGVHNNFRRFTLPYSRNSWLKKHSAREMVQMRKNMINQPIVEPDCMSWRQMEVPYKVYDFERGKRPVPKKNMSDLTGDDYSRKFKTQVSRGRSTKYIDHYINKGEITHRDFEVAHKKQAHKIKHAHKMTPEHMRGYNKIITEPYQLRRLHELGMGKRYLLPYKMTERKGLPHRPEIFVPYTTHDDRSILAWNPVKIRQGQQLGSIPRIQNGSYSVTPGKLKYQVKSAKPITHEIRYTPKSLDKYMGKDAIYRSRFGNRFDYKNVSNRDDNTGKLL
jgi:hypothetical protein